MKTVLILWYACLITLFVMSCRGPSKGNLIISKSQFPCVVVTVAMNDTVKEHSEGLFKITAKKADGQTWEFSSNVNYHVGTTLTLTRDTTNAFETAQMKLIDGYHPSAQAPKKDTTSTKKDSVQ